VTEALVAAVLCLAASTAFLAASVPFLYWKCFRLEARLTEEMAKQDKCIETLDEALSRLLHNVGVPEEKRDV
jgi:hypothetical protein